MVEVGKEYILDIISSDNLGNGIAKVDDFVIFVKRAVCNDKVKVRIVSKSKKYAQASIISVVENSVHRENPKCPYYYQCGGCSFLHVNYDYEKKKKEEYVKRLFKRDFDVYDTSEYNYRTKVILHVKNGELGFYKEHSNEVVSVDSCLLLDDKINKVYKALKNINLENVTEIMIRLSNTNEIMLSIDGEITEDDMNYVVNNNVIVKSVYINNALVYGDEYILNVIDGREYSIYPMSFFQVNLDGMKKIYDVVEKYAGVGSRLLDLYCGTGSIGIYLSSNFNEVYGVEINSDAIRNALINVDLNNLNNIKFLTGDSSCFEEVYYDVIVVDPPRNGLNSNTISKINDMEPKRIVYVSCDVNTLKRDIELLKQYNVSNMSVIHMFPRTNHFECVVLLSRKENI